MCGADDPDVVASGISGPKTARLLGILRDLVGHLNSRSARALGPRLLTEDNVFTARRSRRLRPPSARVETILLPLCIDMVCALVAKASSKGRILLEVARMHVKSLCSALTSQSMLPVGFNYTRLWIVHLHMNRLRSSAGIGLGWL